MTPRSNLNHSSTAVADLTKQVQYNTSRVYTGTNVTNYIDPLWGVVVNGWDVSLKLTYAIEVVGGDAVKARRIRPFY